MKINFLDQELNEKQVQMDEYNKAAKKAEFNLEKNEKRWIQEKKHMQKKIDDAEKQRNEAQTNEREERLQRERT